MRPVVFLALSLLVFGSLACCVTPNLPRIEVHVPTVEVGELQHKSETIRPDGVEHVTVEIVFGAGELEIEAGNPDVLFSGDFRYNVSQWEPKVEYDDGILTVRQGGIGDNLGVPTGSTRNEWKLEFTPQVPLAMEINIGAGRGELDLTSLQLTELEVNSGAGDFDLRFNEANQAVLETFALETGASRVEVRGIGNASPRRMTVQGGVGDINLDFTGKWARSAEIDITAGVGSITLRLPDNVGVKVETEGLSNVNASGFHSRDNGYVNDAFGKTEIELLVHITAGVGAINLRQVSND